MWDDLDDALSRDQAGGDSGQHCTVKARYVPSASPHARQRMQEQVYYLEKRDRADAEDEERELFTAADTGTTRAETRTLLWDNRSARSVLFHRVILSPSTGLGITTTEDARAWARIVMEELGRHLDRDLTWVAAVHGNTGRTHVHVLIAGEAAQPSKGGARRVVRLSKTDLATIRERIAIKAARPIVDARRARDLDATRERQAARMEDLDRRLGVPLEAARPMETNTPAPRAAPHKRRWWRRGA